MRWSVCALLLPVLVALPGCFALDELDQASSEMDRYDGMRSRQPGAQEPEAAPAEDDDGPSLIAQIASWVEDVELPTFGGEGDPASSPVIKCELDGKLVFLRRDDCATRGGRLLK